MNPLKAYYSIIQYCPDLSRLEGVNVGVVLYCPDWRSPILVQVTDSTARIRKFFKALVPDSKLVRSEVRGIKARLEREAPYFQTREALEKFFETRGNAIQFTPLRFVKAVHPEKELESLYLRLVEPAVEKPQTEHPTPEDSLGQLESIPDLHPLLLRNVPVSVPALRRTLTVPYGYQNGRFNLLLPESFRRRNITEATDRACRHAIEGRSLYEQPDSRLGELQLCLVADFPPRNRRLQERVEDVLRENHVELITTTEIPDLIEKIRREGKPLTE